MFGAPWACLMSGGARAATTCGGEDIWKSAALCGVSPAGGADSWFLVPGSWILPRAWLKTWAGSSKHHRKHGRGAVDAFHGCSTSIKIGREVLQAYHGRLKPVPGQPRFAKTLTPSKIDLSQLPKRGAELRAMISCIRTGLPRASRSAAANAGKPLSTSMSPSGACSRVEPWRWKSLIISWERSPEKSTSVSAESKKSMEKGPTESMNPLHRMTPCVERPAASSNQLNQGTREGFCHLPPPSGLWIDIRLLTLSLSLTSCTGALERSSSEPSQQNR